MTREKTYIGLLDNSLKIFFKDALRITLKNPTQAYHFFQTIRWQKRAAKTRSRYAQEGIHVPPIIIFSITNRCNLHCKGCYARAMNRTSHDELSDEELRRIVLEAHELGTSFFVIAGGEPLLRPEIFNIAERFPDILFLIFTNGLLLNQTILKKIKKKKNLVPVISLEGKEGETDGRRGVGVYESLEVIVKKLKQKDIFFSISITVTTWNLPIVTDDQFISGLIDEKCKLFFLLEYTAIHSGTENWMLNEEERSHLNEAVHEYREKYSALFISVPGDEEKFGGCLSAGRGFVHITAQGELEPCPFAPFTDVNLRDLPLKEALKSRLLSVIRDNSDKLDEGQGGCSLWQKREWIQSLLEKSSD